MKGVSSTAAAAFSRNHIFFHAQFTLKKYARRSDVESQEAAFSSQGWEDRLALRKSLGRSFSNEVVLPGGAAEASLGSANPCFMTQVQNATQTWDA